MAIAASPPAAARARARIGSSGGRTSGGADGGGAIAIEALAAAVDALEGEGTAGRAAAVEDDFAGVLVAQPHAARLVRNSGSKRAACDNLRFIRPALLAIDRRSTAYFARADLPGRSTSDYARQADEDRIARPHCRSDLMLRDLVGAIGAQFIYLLIRIFGRRHQRAEIPWLSGPVGSAHIGDAPYEETARAEGLTLERHSRSGGLIPSFDVLASAAFDPARVHPKIRDFYERTPEYRFDTWSTTYFPARIALWLLVTTISRKVDQLNFPLDGLDTAQGMTSEIVLLRDPSGAIRYTGWFRKLQRTGTVIYTGFYTTARPPLLDGACVKVVFPMPNGNATVLLRPENDEGNGFKLASVGRGFGDVGFYRVQNEGSGVRVWNIRTLHETFRLYVDESDTVHCEHDVRFLGLRVLTLHYRIAPVAGGGANANA